MPSVLYAELDVGREIPHVDVAELTPLSFYRDYVARNKPVIISGMHTSHLTTCTAVDGRHCCMCFILPRLSTCLDDEGALNGWPALEDWNNESLAQRMGPAQACVNLNSCTAHPCRDASC